MTPSRTATITSGFVEVTTKSLHTMFGSAQVSKSTWFQNVNITNTGEDADLFVAVLFDGDAAAVAIDALVIPPGEARVIPKINSRWTYVWTSDDSVDNRLEFVAEVLDEFRDRYALS